MIQMNTYVDVADNTGAKQAMVFRVLKGSTSRHGKFSLQTADIGDTVVIAVKKAQPTGDVKEHDVVRAIVVRSTKAHRRSDGSYVKFDRNAVVVVNAENEPRGTRIFGAVARELRERGYLKIVSLASEVV